VAGPDEADDARNAVQDLRRGSVDRLVAGELDITDDLGADPVGQACDLDRMGDLPAVEDIAAGIGADAGEGGGALLERRSEPVPGKLRRAASATTVSIIPSGR
jgi:hypothetical protein